MRDYLGQYDTGGSWHAETFRNNIQLAKAAYARTPRKSSAPSLDSTDEEEVIHGHGHGHGPGSGSGSGSTSNIHDGGMMLTGSETGLSAARRHAKEVTACPWVPAVMKENLGSWDTFDALALDEQLRRSRGANGGVDDGGGVGTATAVAAAEALAVVATC